MWTICKNCDASNSTSQKNVLLALANSIKLEFWCFGYRLQNFQRKRAHSWHLNQQCLQKSESLASLKKWRATSHLYFLNLNLYMFFFGHIHERQCFRIWVIHTEQCSTFRIKSWGQLAPKFSFLVTRTRILVA